MSGTAKMQNEILAKAGFNSNGVRPLILSEMPTLSNIEEFIPAGSIDFSKNVVLLYYGKNQFGQDTVNGFILGKDNIDGKVKFEIGNSATKIFKYDGTNLTLIGGDLSAGSINIPNATNPLFSVDTSGNVAVASLRRKDYHLFTIFDGIQEVSAQTGWSLDKGLGTGLGLESVNLQTAATTNADVSLYKQSTMMAGTAGFSWDKKFAFKTWMKLGNDFDGGTQNFNFGRGFVGQAGLGADANRKVAFYIVNTTIYGVMADNSTEANVSLMSTNSLTGSGALFEVSYDPATGASFYINNVLKGSIATNMPSGFLGAGYMITYYLKTGENVSKTVDLCWADFWQAL